MTRRECERKLMFLAIKMLKTIKSHDPNMESLHVSIFNDGHISINNNYFDEDAGCPIQVFGNYVDDTKASDYRFSTIYGMTLMEEKCAKK